MLDLGFIHDLRRIVGLLPRKRQTLFFSATMPKAIEDLAAKYLTNPVKVAVKPAATTAERVEQAVIFVNQAEKPALLQLVLRTSRSTARWSSPAPSMAPTVSSASSAMPASLPRRFMATRASRSANARWRPSRLGTCNVLVATDIAARGIDVSGVSHVINYELPNVPESYVHRIGRTARAGRQWQGDRLLCRRRTAVPARISKS
jgi:ATP-dependent RNA helicase RhlE